MRKQKIKAILFAIMVVVSSLGGGDVFAATLVRTIYTSNQSTAETSCKSYGGNYIEGPVGIGALQHYECYKNEDSIINTTITTNNATVNITTKYFNSINECINAGGTPANGVTVGQIPCAISGNSTSESSKQDYKTRIETQNVYDITRSECNAKGEGWAFIQGGTDETGRCQYTKTIKYKEKYVYDWTATECRRNGGTVVGSQGDEYVICLVEEIIEDDVNGGGGGVDDFDIVTDGSGWSRGEHPGRSPTGSGNSDPNGGNFEVSPAQEAMTGNGYSWTGGVQVEDEVQEATTLNCDANAEGGGGIFCILKNVITVMTWGVGIVGTLGLVIVGVQYATARDNVEQMTKARKRLVAIIIGLVAYVLFWGFINWLIPGGLV